MNHSYVWSDLEIHPGIVRTIATLPDRGCVAISTWRDRQPAGRFLVYPSQVEVIRRAVSDARDPNLRSRRDAGSWTTDTGLTIQCWASRRSDGQPTVSLGRMLGSDRIGGPTSLIGSEIDALDAALDWLSPDAETAA
jgi:hypothetical protein